MSAHFEARQRLTTEAKAQATASPRAFLARVGIHARRGRDYRCPKCSRFRLCAYPAKDGGHTFTCHKCKPGTLDAIGLYQWVHDATFSDARDWLLSITGLGDVDTREPRSIQAPLTAPTQPTEPDASRMTMAAFRVGASALLLASRPLTLDSTAGGYLGARGLFDIAVDTGLLHLGSTPADVRNLARRARDSIGEDVAILSGLWRPGNDKSFGHAVFPFAGHTLLIPWLDCEGRIAGLRRRVVGPPGDLPKYVASKGAPVPPLPFMHRGDAASCMSEGFSRLVITEGEFDALALRARGEAEGVIPGGCLVVATGGASMTGRFLTQPGWRALLEGREVLLALDGDTAGREASQRLATALQAVGVHGRILVPRGGKDWCETLAGAA